jgi:TetR/AcrR family transcriptional regulator, transcriptional repressor of bet genes
LPRHVDHDERRRVLAEALWRITEREGLEAVSMRDVAAEAGMTSAQHYFASKDEMLAYAFEYMVERTVDRVYTAVEREQAAGFGENASHDLLQETARSSLWTEPELLGQSRVWIAFVARAVVRPEFAAVLRKAYDELHEGIVRILTYAQSVGGLANGVDPEAEATALIGLIDGLSMHCLIGVTTHEKAVELVGSHVRGLFR